MPEIPGADKFPGQQLHTHNFRTNSNFKDKTVVIMGASASGQDIAREIADVAKKVCSCSSLRTLKSKGCILEQRQAHHCGGPKTCLRRVSITLPRDLQSHALPTELQRRTVQVQFPGYMNPSTETNLQHLTIFLSSQVYFSARSMKFGAKLIIWESSDVVFGEKQNMVRRAAISQIHADGSVSFADGWQAKNVDIIVYATGYHYRFPFLQKSGVVTVTDNRSASILIASMAANSQGHLLGMWNIPRLICQQSST